MRLKGKRILSLALAAVMAASFPLMDLKVQAEGTQAAATVTKPTLPDGFGNPLEDNNGLTLATGATTVQIPGFGTAINSTINWNNQNQGHATFNNAGGLFARTAFTVLMDVRQDTPNSDSGTPDKAAMLSIGKAGNSIHLVTYSGKLGYGDTSAGGGVSAHMTELAGIDKGSWNAVAMTYEETNGGNGHVIVYINGQKAGEVADIGFKLSAMSDLTAMIARSFSTSYIQVGQYDNIVVGNTVLDEATAIAETAYRKQQKDNLPDVDYYVFIKGSDVDAAAENINGLTYKGFGMLNGNSTSNLLLDYKYENPEKYNEMMEYLFGGEYPLFTHIKMEMGNDGNNSTGAEACTMRYEDEEADASRSPGFVMVADAKKINPNVKVSILRWEVPNWVAEKNTNLNDKGEPDSAKLSGEACREAAYKWYKETIFDAYEKYGYMVDFVDPDKNETGNPDTEFIKWFSNRVKNETEFPSYMDDKAQAAYKNIRIIASDENKGLKIVPAMRNDRALYNAVDIIGFHYRTDATDDYVKMADVDDKEVWYSEGCATFGYSELQENKTIEYGANTIGGYQSPLALVDSFITAFSSSRRTHYMFQPAIGSFYEGIQYGHKELLSARDPWSGYIHYDPALYMLEHFAKFAKTGWEDSEPGNDIWRVINNATSPAFAGTSNEHATAGIDGNAGYMTLASPDKKNFSVVIVNNTRNEKSFLIDAQDVGVSVDKLNLWETATDSYMQNKGTIEKQSGGWNVTVPAYSVSTATTLGATPERAPVDDIHNEDRAVLDTDKTGHTNGVTTDNVLYADDFEYNEEPADYLEERGNEPRYMLDTHGAWIVEDGRLKQELASGVAQWNPGDPSTVVGDFRWMDYKTSVDVEIPNASSSVYARISVRTQTGMGWNDSGYTLELSGSGTWKLYRIGTVVEQGTVKANEDGKYNVEIAALGDTINVIIDNRPVATYKDATPILSGRVKLSSTWDQMYYDNLLIKTIDGGIPYALSMVDGQDDSVTYEGQWDINNPGSGNADHWYRTLSITSTPNAAFSFKVKGCGFAILGSNDGTAKLDVTVDGEKKAENADTLASPARGETYILSDLPNGEHEINVVVKSGKLQIDALYGLAERSKVAENAAVSVKTEIASVPNLASGDINEVVKNLPKQVDVETGSGAVVKKDVVWNINASQFEGKEFSQASISGTVLDTMTSLGTPMIVSVPVGMVVPSGTVYFIDSVKGNPSEINTTEPYETVKGIIGDQLLNQVYDQKKTDSNTWGLVTDTAQTREGNTTDMMDTGLYGKDNKTGETLAYAFTLPAGKYKLISGHREWWTGPRTMAATISFAGQSQDAGTVSPRKGIDYINTALFELDSEQLVTYTLTAQTNQAPVIGWLAVIKVGDAQTPGTEPEHVHDYTHIINNGDGTHSLLCKDGDDIKKQNHTLNYVDNSDGTHKESCKVCDYEATVNHAPIDKDNGNGTHTGTCACGYKNSAVNHDLVYRDNRNGTHTGTCVCGYKLTVNHDLAYENNGNGTHKESCGICGYKKLTVNHDLAYENNGNGKHTGTCACGFSKIEDHSLSYTDNGNGKHTGACACGYSKTEDHSLSYTDNGNGKHNVNCETCGYSETEEHSLSYTDNGNGTHQVSCETCQYSEAEDHSYKNNICEQCKANMPVSISLSKPVISALTNESSGVKISWKKVSNAEGYYVYRKTGSGKPQKVGTITKNSMTSWTDTGVNKKNGTTYQYQVYAYKGTVTSKASAAKTIIRLTANKLGSVKNVKGKKLQVKWAKNAKAAGYEIQYSTSSKFSVAKKTKVSGAKKTSGIVKGLKKGKTYYVRIRCYKKSGKTTYTSSWSSSKQVKIKN